MNKSSIMNNKVQCAIQFGNSFHISWHGYDGGRALYTFNKRNYNVTSRIRYQNMEWLHVILNARHF